jgi:hypothetical protein
VLQGELGETLHAWLEGEGDPLRHVQIGQVRKYNIIFIFKIFKKYINN